MKVPKTEKEIHQEIVKRVYENKAYKKLIKSNNAIINILCDQLEIVYRKERYDK